MPTPTKRQKHLANARRAIKQAGRLRGAVVCPPQPSEDARNQPVLDHSCVCCSDALPSARCIRPSQPKKPRKVSPEPSIDAGHPPTEAEKTFAAVAELQALRTVAKATKTRVSRTAVSKIAKKIKVTPRHLRRLSRWSVVRSLFRRPGSGRRVSATSSEVKEWFVQKSHELGGAWATRTMAAAMREKWGHGSQTTVCRLAHALGFRHVRQRVHPVLSSVAKQRRLAWANEQLAKPGGPFAEPDTVYVHVDEKWFFAHLLKRHFWVAPNEKPPSVELESKTHITKVMFLGAVARPVPERNFDGRVGLYPVSEQVPAMRRSKHREKGELHWKLVNMDAVLFKRYLKEFVVPDVLAATGMWVKRIVIQMDNAGGHGGGKGDMNKTTIADLNAWAGDLPEEYARWWPAAEQPEIVFVAQPPRSPDTNALDLGIWTSLQVAVEQAKQRQGLVRLKEDDIIDICKEAWASWPAAATLTKIFNTLENVLLCIQAAEGGNGFDIPHARDLFF